MIMDATVELDVEECLTETAKALFVRLEDGEKYWIPKSIIQGGEVKEPGDSGPLEIPEWFAEKVGII